MTYGFGQINIFSEQCRGQMVDAITQRPHPGPFLKKEIFKPQKIKIAVAAELMQIHPRYLYNTIGEWNTVNLQLCHRLAIVFGENAEIWATRQLQYDLDKTAGGTRMVDPDYHVPKNLPRIHPGTILREKVMMPNRLTLEKTAELIDKHASSVSKITAGIASLDLETCLKLEKLFGENAEYWAIRQMRYDLDQKRAEVEQEGLKRWKPE